MSWQLLAQVAGIQPRNKPDICYRSWNIGKKGELSEAGAREKAHKDRITTILWHKNFLYSLGYDGCIKMWDANKLELVMEVKKAHAGQRIQCAAVAPDGCLYTGGDDKVGTQTSRGGGEGRVQKGSICVFLLGLNVMDCRWVFLVITQINAGSDGLCNANVCFLPKFCC